jgi:hypothetical protein
MDTDDTTESQPQHETPRDNTVQKEQVDDDGVSTQREGDDENKSEEGAVPSDGDKLPGSKALDHGQSKQGVHNKDVKVNRDPLSTAARPGAVSVPGIDATAATSAARKPSGIAPQTNQLREPPLVAGPSRSTKKNRVVKIEPSMIASFDDSQVKMKEKAERANSQASDTAVQSIADAVEKPPIQPGAVTVQGALTQQNRKLRTGPQQPVAQPGAVAVQRPVAAVRKKGYTETAAAVRKKGSTDRASQPREPAAVAGRAIAAKRGSKDQDIESGLLVSTTGMVDLQRESVRLGGGVSSSDDVRPGAMAVQPGTTITTQNVDMSASPAPTMHTPCPNILTSKAAIANRTAAVQVKASMNGATGVTEGAIPVSEKSLDKDESGALSEAEEPRAGAVAVPAAAGMEALDMARPSNYGGPAVNGDNTVHIDPKAMLVTAYTVNEVDQDAIFYKARLAAEADVRRQMRTVVVDAEIVDEPKDDQQCRRRRCFQFSLLALIVIVTAVVGGVVGSQSGGGFDMGPSLSPSMSASLSSLSSMAPSTSASPSALPSMAPSMAPSMSASPSSYVFQGTYHG